MTVKRVTGGVVSGWLHARVRPGHTIEVGKPAGWFTLRPGDGPILFLAAGSGVTPIYALLRQALTGTRPIILVTVHRTPEAAIFGPAIRALADGQPDRLRLIEILTAGRIGDRFAPARACLSGLAGADAYICGPSAFMDAAAELARSAGIADDRILFERFLAATPTPDDRPAGLAAHVTMRLHGVERTFTCGPGDTLLEAGLATGAALPFGCREGHCGACMVKLVTGEVAMTDAAALSRRDRARGFVLACRAVPASATLTLDYDL